MNSFWLKSKWSTKFLPINALYLYRVQRKIWFRETEEHMYVKKNIYKCNESKGCRLWNKKKNYWTSRCEIHKWVCKKCIERKRNGAKFNFWKRDYATKFSSAENYRYPGCGGESETLHMKKLLDDRKCYVMVNKTHKELYIKFVIKRKNIDNRLYV